MEGTPMKLVIIIVGLLGGIALVGAITLKGLALANGIESNPVPNEMWMIVTGSIATLGALLANPRSGSSTNTDTRTIPMEDVESLKIDKEVSP